MSEISAILLDIDGCVLDPSGKLVDSNEFLGFGHHYYDGLRQLAHHVYKANCGEKPPISFCSGRPQAYVEAIAYTLGLPNSWSIVESGLFLYNPCSKARVENPALTQELKQTFKDIAADVIPAVLKQSPGLFLYVGNELNIAIEKWPGNNVPMKECYEAIKRALREALSMATMLVTMHYTDSAVDISPTGIDKASGVELWQTHTGHDLSEVLGIGDSHGDFPMFEKVGHIGCPSNASDECKKLVRERDGYVSPYLLTMGVMDVINHWE